MRKWEPRFMEHGERQDEDIISLRDEKWLVWNKREGMQIFKIRHETKINKFTW